MQPDVLGLHGDESAAYRALIAVPSAGAGELAALLRVTAHAAAGLLAGLETAGLAARSPGDPERFVAEPPATVLRDALQRRRLELLRAEADLGALDEVYRGARLRRGAAGVVDVVHGAAAVREMFERLQLGAREEVLSLVKAPIAVVSGAENVAEDAAVARGVRYRVVFERAMLDEEPDAFERIVAARAAGEEIRIAGELPLKLLVVDREQAFMPLHPAGAGQSAVPGALLVHESGLLQALLALFEAEWRRASAVVTEAQWRRASAVATDAERQRGSAPETGAEWRRASAAVTEAGPPALDAMDARIVSLLMTGLTDEAVAAHLGTSLRTVQRRVRQLMEVTGGRTRMQLGFHVARLGWWD